MVQLSKGVIVQSDNFTRGSCPKTQMYIDGEFKNKTARRNGYGYIGFGL